MTSAERGGHPGRVPLVAEGLREHLEASEAMTGPAGEAADERERVLGDPAEGDVPQHGAGGEDLAAVPAPQHQGAAARASAPPETITRAPPAASGRFEAIDPERAATSRGPAPMSATPEREVLGDDRRA